MNKLMIIIVILILSVGLFSIQPDKVMHTSCSFMINTSSYIALKYYTDQKPAMIALESCALTLGIGVVKELSDKHFSKEDLFANCIGIGLSAIPIAILEPFDVGYMDDYLTLSYKF